MRSLRPGKCLLGNTQRSEPVSTKNLSLLPRSVMNRRPEVMKQASAAINACRCRFLAGGRSTVVYICAPCPRIAGGTGINRSLLGCGPGKECSDGCSGRKRSDFCDPVGLLTGGVQVVFGLARQYGLDVGRQPARPVTS